MREGLIIGGKYRLAKLIGSGGMGQVWLARNELTEREFAIKFLHPQAAANPKVLTRFLQEAKVSGRLRHPGILEIFDVGTAAELEGAPFLVMELLDGLPLDVAIRALDGLPVRFTLLVSISIARALRVAHDKGVVHRDLKPANVFLHRPDGPSGGIVPKLLDFGISKLSPLEASGGESMGLTQTGAILGSPLYMSPEQAAGDKHVDGRSDLHALGVLMWWCLAARSPFTSTTYNNLVVEIITGERPSLTDVKADVPAGVAAIVSKAFARKREDRYANATEMLVALEMELANLGPGPALDSKAWVDEVLGKITPAQSAAMRAAQPQEPKETTTNGAVSVSLDDVLAPSAPGSARSPAAYTFDSRSSSPSHAGVVPMSASSGGALAQARSTSPGTTGAEPRRGMGIGALAALAGGGVLFLVLVVIAAVALGKSRASAANGDPLPALGAAATTATITTATPTATATPTPTADDTTPDAAAVASAAPTHTATSKPQAWGGGAPQPAKPAPTPKPAQPAPQPTGNDPFRGVTGSGL